MFNRKFPYVAYSVCYLFGSGNCWPAFYCNRKVSGESMKTLKALFKPKSVDQILARELYEAQVGLIEAQKQASYYEALIGYYQNAIIRTEAGLKAD